MKYCLYKDQGGIILDSMKRWMKVLDDSIQKMQVEIKRKESGMNSADTSTEKEIKKSENEIQELNITTKNEYEERLVQLINVYKENRLKDNVEVCLQKEDAMYSLPVTNGNNCEQYREEKQKLISIYQNDNKKRIVNAGLLKAGKSTLFNAIIGGEKFETSVVRATKRIQEEELKNFILIDTPGLDACEQDTEIALQGYRNADIIVFVHNVQEGEFNQVEIDSINKIAGIFGDRSSFFRNAILVLTHKDQMEDECDRIQKQIEQQSQSILSSQFSKIISVNSEGYIRGVAENKQLLIEDSGIPNLIQELNDRIKKVSDLRRSLFDLERKKLINKLEAEITDVREKTPVVDRTKVNEIDRLIAYNKSEISNVKKAINGMKVDVSHIGSYRWCARDENSYKGYKWSFQAEDAAKEAIRKTIKETASRVKTDAVRIVDEAEKYITPSKEPSDVRKKLSTAYEQMRKEALKYDVSVKTDFNIKIHIPEDSNYALDPARSNARDINSASFYSVDHYAKDNITIKDFKTYETVQTIFGPIDREVTKYNYYAHGAMDDIADDAERLMRDVMYDVSSGIDSVFKTIKDDLLKQFKQITDSMNKELINEKKNREQVISQKENEKKLCENYLAQLENIRNEVMSL
jgi:hypothetical protein